MHKILVFSDSHGKDGWMEKVLSEEKGFDAVFHLGDLEETEEDFRRMLDRVNPLAAYLQVRGNCDYAPTMPSLKTVEYYGVRFLLAHGHRYRVHESLELLATAARENECYYALFGHTHVPARETCLGVFLMNPGSISLPRQGDHRNSYGVLTVTEKKDVEFTIKYMDRVV